MPDARYMAPELLESFRPLHEETAGRPLHEGTAESTSLTHFTPISPSSTSVSQPYVPHGSHIKIGNHLSDDIFCDRQNTIFPDHMLAHHFEGIEDVRAARDFSKHGERGEETAETLLERARVFH